MPERTTRHRSNRPAAPIRDSAARRFTAPLPQRLRAYGHIHAHSLFASLGRLRQTPFSTAMTIVVIAITLSFPTGFHVLVKNIQAVSGSLATSNQISLFLKPDITDATGAAVAKRLKQKARVEAVTLIGKKEALREFQSFSGFGEALDALEANPLPVVIQIQPDESLKQPAELALLLKELENLPEADFAQLDMQWVERLQTMTMIAERVVMMLSVLLGVGVIFIVGNTIRLELENRKEEVVVTKLVGGTDAFIRRPFLYCGFWYGFASSLLAWLIVTVTLLLLKGPVQRLSTLYDSHYHLLFLDAAAFFRLVAFASLLGIAGAWLVLAQQLHRLNPE